MEIQPEILLATGLIVLAAYFIRGISGFGLTPLQMQRLTGIILLVSGTTLLWRAWA